MCIIYTYYVVVYHSIVSISHINNNMYMRGEGVCGCQNNPFLFHSSSSNLQCFLLIIIILYCLQCFLLIILYHLQCFLIILLSVCLSVFLYLLNEEEERKGMTMMISTTYINNTTRRINKKSAKKKDINI